MSKRNPLRRLSVALRLTEAYQPSMPVSPSDAPSLSKFLTKQKTNWLQDVKENPVSAAENWTVVMGNEAGDLDSLASSIAYAWILTEWKQTPAIPLIQVERADLALRSENLYALKLAGISESELLTLTEITELGLKPFPGHKFALVDHNRIGSAYTIDNPKADVIAVVDHHEDEKLYPNADPRIIAKAGSCASHVATLLPPDPLPEVATLLLTAILIDTDGLKPGGKAEQVDRDSALTVATKSTLSNSIPPLSALAPIDSSDPDALYETQAIKDLTATLSDKKSDVSHLSGFDLLRRDYKEYTHPLTWAPGSPSIKVGLSTVPSPLQAWGAKGQLEKDAVKWMTQRGITALGVLTSFRETKSAAGKIADVAKKASGSGKVDKGKHKREQAWIILNEPELSHLGAPTATSEDSSVLTIDVLAERFFSGLESAKALELERHKKFGDVEKSKDLPPKSKARVYKQGIANATRKVTAPIVKAVLEGGEMPVFGGEAGEDDEEAKGKKKEKGKDKEKKKDKEGKKDKKKKDDDDEVKEKSKDEDEDEGKKKDKGKDKDKKKDKEGKKDKKKDEDGEKEKDKKKDKGKDKDKKDKKDKKKSVEIEAESSNVAEVKTAKN